LEGDPADPDKVPYIAGSNRRASSTDPSTWTSFETAANLKNGDAGLGFVFTLEAGIVGIDLDDCIDASGKIATWAGRIVQRVASYTERSPSGRGLHIFVRGALPPGARKRGLVEMYDSGRYFTMTGDVLEGTPATIERVDMGWLHRLMSAGLFDFSKDRKLEALLNGVWEGSFPSQSEADLSFCWALARLGLSGEDIDSAFRLSGLFRQKWDSKRGSETYGQITIRSVAQPQPATTAPQVEASPGRPLEENKGKLRPLLENAVLMLSGMADYQGLKFSEFTLRTTIDGRDWADVDDLRLACTFQRAGLYVGSQLSAEAAQLVATSRPYHEVRDYLKALVWDGTARLETLLSKYFGATDSPYVRAVGVCWSISAVARVIIPGCQCDYVPVLIGRQGTGKSSGLRALFGAEWFSDHPPILGSRDSYLGLMGCWCVELSELSAVRRAEVEAVKSFLTTRIDHFRKPYGRRAEAVPRQCVFAATTNDLFPFVDSTGNRRFWPVSTGRVDVQGIAAARDQLWAEAYARFQTGAPRYLPAELEALATAEQESRFEPGPWDDLILKWAKNPSYRAYKNSNEFMPSLSVESPGERIVSTPGKVLVYEVLLHGIGKSADSIRDVDSKAVARCLRHNGWIQRQEGAGPHRGKRFWHAPEVQK